jgi:hypothetical protein
MIHQPMISPIDHHASPHRESHKEGPMFDRDRFLAADHEARLHADAEARRLSALARSARPTSQGRTAAGLRAALGHWLVATDGRLAPEPDPREPRSA